MDIVLDPNCASRPSGPEPRRDWPTLAELGVDPDAVIRQAGVDPKLLANPDAVIAFTALGWLVTECLKATGCECFGLRVGMKTRPTGLGLTGLVSIHSPTVREGLAVITATLQTSDTGGATFLDLSRGVAEFGYAVTAPAIESADQISTRRSRSPST